MATAALERLTDEQRSAVTLRGVSVALSAGAGCGKTHVLTERFLAHLESGDAESSLPRDATSRLPRVVAITFTDRAAREMRERIRRRCHERLLTAGDADAPGWLALLRQIEGARISTIHSFCASLLRSHAVEAALDPRFGVMDESQARTLLSEALDDTLRRRLAARDATTIDLAATWSLDQLRRSLMLLLDSRHAPAFDRYRGWSPEQLVAHWQQTAQQHWFEALCRAVSGDRYTRRIKRIVAACMPTHRTMQERFQTLREWLPRLDDADPREAMRALADAARVQHGGGAKAWPDERTYEAFKNAASEVRGRVKATLELFEQGFQVSVREAQCGLGLLRIAADVVAAYDDSKRELAQLDYDDLLVRARALLTAPQHEPLRRRVAAGIDLLLVDEFQDTDPVQVGLIRALCGDDLLRGKLFFVGDYKQSIYRFRGADPQVFRELGAEIPPAGRLPLTLNFRSQPAILDFVNALFCEAMGDGYEPLRAHVAQRSPLPAVEWLWATWQGPPGAQARVDVLRRLEARWIARRLRELLEDGQPLVRDGDDLRAPQRGDVALLFRALTDVQYYEEALREEGIRYYLVGGSAFYSQQEVFDLIHLLKALTSPADEIALVGALRSPFFSLADETLLWLARHPQGVRGGLFARPLPRQLDREQRRRAEFAANTLAELSRLKDRRSIAGLLRTALERTGYDALLLAEFLGERKLANLHKLIDQARVYDRSGFLRLADFVVDLSQFVARQPKEALAATEPETSDVVRLMSIHQAKGLEFPIVVVPDVCRAERGSSDSVVLSDELGPLVSERNEEQGTSSVLTLHRELEKEADRQESLRLFYVAATRAADYLILSAAGQGEWLDNPSAPWLELLTERFDQTSGQLLAPLPAGAGVPCIRVTTSEPPARPREGAVRRRALEAARARIEAAPVERDVELPTVARIEVDRAARRTFSFSRLAGTLQADRSRVPTDDRARFEDGSDLTIAWQALPDKTHRTAAPQKAGGAAREPDVANVAGDEAAALGSLVHDVLSARVWERPSDLADLARSRAPLYMRQPESGTGPAEDMIARFLESQRAADLAAAAELHTELDFLMSWPESSDPATARQLTGVIDCLYRGSDGRLRVLDYKTNLAAADEVPALAARYELQMLVYGEAVSRIFKELPAELVLVFLRPGVEWAIRFDDEARARARREIDAALAQATG